MSNLPSPQPAGTNIGLRVVIILILIASVLGLVGTGLCFVSVIDDANLPVFLLILTPLVLFFGGVIWVCKALLKRLSKRP